MNVNGTINTGTATETDLVTGTPAQAVQKRGRRWRLIVLGVVVVFAGALTSGAWNHLTQYRLTAAAAERERDLVPQVRVAAVEGSNKVEVVRLPATTSAFTSANIFARA